MAAQADLQRIFDQYGQHIKTASDITGLDPNALTALIYTESAGKPDSISSANAYGLTQILPATAVEIAGELGYTDFDNPGDLAKQLLRDPELSIIFGAHYFKKRLDESGGDFGRAYHGYHDGPSNPQYRAGQPPLGPEGRAGVARYNDALSFLGGPIPIDPTEPSDIGGNVANEYVRRLPTDTASGGVPGIAGQDISGRMALSNIFRGISPTLGMAAVTESRENPLVAGMRGMVDAGTLGYGDPTRGEPQGETQAARLGHAVGMGVGTGASFVPAMGVSAPLRAVPYVGRALQPAGAFALHSAAQRVDTPEGMSGADALAQQIESRAKMAGKGAVTGAALGTLGMVPGIGALMHNKYTGPLMDTAVLTGMQAIEGQPITPLENLAFVGGMRGASAATAPMMPKTRGERDAATKAKIREENAAAAKAQAERQAKLDEYAAMGAGRPVDTSGLEALRAQMRPQLLLGEGPMITPPPNPRPRVVRADRVYGPLVDEAPAYNNLDLVRARVAGDIASGRPAAPESLPGEAVPTIYPDQYTGGPTGGAVAVGRRQFRAPAPPNEVEPLSYEGQSLRNATVPGRRVFRKPYQPFNPEQPYNTAAEAEAAAALEAARPAESGPRRKGRRSRTVTLESGGGQAIYEAASGAVSRAQAAKAAKEAARMERLRAEVAVEDAAAAAAASGLPVRPTGGAAAMTSKHPLAGLVRRYVDGEIKQDQFMAELAKNPELMSAGPEVLEQILVEKGYGKVNKHSVQFFGRRQNINRISGQGGENPLKDASLRVGEVLEMMQPVMNNEFQSNWAAAFKAHGVQPNSPTDHAVTRFLKTAYGVETDAQGRKFAGDPMKAAQTPEGIKALEGLTPEQVQQVLAVAPKLRTETLRQHQFHEIMRQLADGRSSAVKNVEAKLLDKMAKRGLHPDNPDAEVAKRLYGLTQASRNRGKSIAEVAATKAGKRILSEASDATAVVEAVKDIAGVRKGVRGLWAEAYKRHGIEQGSGEDRAMKWLLGAATEAGTTPERVARTAEGAKQLGNRVPDATRQKAVVDAAMDLTDTAVGRKQFALAVRSISGRPGRGIIGFQEKYLPDIERNYSAFPKKSDLKAASQMWGTDKIGAIKTATAEPRQYWEKLSRTTSGSSSDRANPRMWSAREQARGKQPSLRPDQMEQSAWELGRVMSADTARMVARTAALTVGESAVKAMRFEAKQVKKAGDGKRADAINGTADALSAVLQQAYNGKLPGISGKTIDAMSSTRPTKVALEGMLAAKQAFNRSRYTLAAPFIAFRQWTSIGMSLAHGEITPEQLGRAIVASRTPQLRQEFNESYTHWVKTRRSTRMTREGTLADDAMQGPLDKPLSKAEKLQLAADKPTMAVEDWAGRIAYAIGKEMARNNPQWTEGQRRAFASDVAGMTASFYDKGNRAAILSDPILNLAIPAQGFAVEGMNTMAQLGKGYLGPRAHTSRRQSAKQAAAAGAAMFALNLMGTWLVSYHKDDWKKLALENAANTGLSAVPYVPQAYGVGPMASDIYTQQMTKDVQTGIQKITDGDVVGGLVKIAKDFAPAGMMYKRLYDAWDLHQKGVIDEDEILGTAIFGATFTESGSEYLGRKRGKRKAPQNVPRATQRGRGGSGAGQRQAPRRKPYRRPERER